MHFSHYYTFACHLPQIVHLHLKPLSLKTEITKYLEPTTAQNANNQRLQNVQPEMGYLYHSLSYQGLAITVECGGREIVGAGAVDGYNETVFGTRQNG